MMRIKVQVQKTKVFKTHVLKTYLTLKINIEEITLTLFKLSPLLQ